MLTANPLVWPLPTSGMNPVAMYASLPSVMKGRLRHLWISVRGLPGWSIDESRQAIYRSLYVVSNELGVPLPNVVGIEQERTLLDNAYDRRRLALAARIHRPGPLLADISSEEIDGEEILEDVERTVSGDHNIEVVDTEDSNSSIAATAASTTSGNSVRNAVGFGFADVSSQSRRETLAERQRAAQLSGPITKSEEEEALKNMTHPDNVVLICQDEVSFVKALNLRVIYIHSQWASARPTVSQNMKEVVILQPYCSPEGVSDVDEETFIEFENRK